MSKMTNREVLMSVLITMVRLGIIDKTPLLNDFPFYMVWFNSVKAYSDRYGVRNEA